MVKLLLLPHFLLVPLLMGVAVLLAVGGLLLFMRVASNDTLQANSAAIGAMFGLISFLFAIVVGSLVSLGWTRYNQAQGYASQEAGYAGDMLRSAQGLAEPARTQLATLVVRYAQEVVGTEWPAMVNGRPVAVSAPAYEALWDYLIAFQPASDHDRTFYGLALGELQGLGEQRRLRAVATQTEPPAFLWILLIAGSALAIFFTYLFPAKNPKFRVLKVGLVAAMLGFVFYLLVSLQYPFAGELTPSPQAFQNIIDLWAPRLGL